MTSVPSPTMPEIEITSEEVYTLLSNVNSSKAAGPNKITARILVMCTEELAPVLADFYQQTLEEESVPTEWQAANVAPIFKKGTEQSHQTTALFPSLLSHAR